MKLQLTRNHYVAAAMVLLAGMLIGYLVGNPSTRQQEVAKWTREEFWNLVLNETPEQIIKAVGRPYRTHEGTSTIWYYRGIKDTLTGEIGEASVMFWNGKASNISY